MVMFPSNRGPDKDTMNYTLCDYSQCLASASLLQDLRS